MCSILGGLAAVFPWSLLHKSRRGGFVGVASMHCNPAAHTDQQSAHVTASLLELKPGRLVKHCGATLNVSERKLIPRTGNCSLGLSCPVPCQLQCPLLAGALQLEESVNGLCRRAAAWLTRRHFLPLQSLSQRVTAISTRGSPTAPPPNPTGVQSGL